MSEMCREFGPGVLPSQVLQEDIGLFHEIRSLRYFTHVFHKQGKASQYSGGAGSLTPDEEQYLESIQDVIDERAQSSRRSRSFIPARTPKRTAA